MKKGLVFGKFLPLHNGHLALMSFAKSKCDLLYIVVCASTKETIDGETRKKWIIQSNPGLDNIEVLVLDYNEANLPNTSVSSEAVSLKWAKEFQDVLPDIDVVFTSEPYGDFVAAAMGIEHEVFDKERKFLHVSASMIRNDAFKYWNLIPQAVRPWYVKKVVILGSESTGKSFMTEKLAAHFSTAFVPEMAREIVEHTDTCTYEHLLAIATLHAKEIERKRLLADKLLFIDTDLNITCSYSRFLFNKELVADDWIIKANKADLYIFLEPDCEYIQDGTRLSYDERNELSMFHESFLKEQGIVYHKINGKEWDDRFNKAVKLIEESFK